MLFCLCDASPFFVLTFSVSRSLCSLLSNLNCCNSVRILLRRRSTFNVGIISSFPTELYPSPTLYIYMNYDAVRDTALRDGDKGACFSIAFPFDGDLQSPYDTSVALSLSTHQFTDIFNDCYQNRRSLPSPSPPLPPYRSVVRSPAGIVNTLHAESFEERERVME